MRKSLISPITGITHDLSAPMCLEFNMLQYGVLSSYKCPLSSIAHAFLYIVGLVRFCLGSIVTSNDLPPDLHSNHIEILYSIDLLRIGPAPAYTLFVYLPSRNDYSDVAKYFNMESVRHERAIAHMARLRIRPY